MTPRSLVFLAAAAFLSTTAHAQNLPPDQWCQSNYGPGYTAKYEPDGSFIGECIAPPVTICTGNMYIHPKTGAGLCCDVAGTVMKVDTGYNEAECCQPTQIFKWNPSSRTGACTAPPPIVVPTTISCPGSHFATISRGGRNWRIYCNHNVKEWVPPLQKIRAIGTLLSGNAPSTGDDVNSCLNKCIADPNCNGANLWQKQSNCSLQNKGKQGSIFSSGDLYLAVPPVALLNKPVIAIVAIPRRV